MRRRRTTGRRGSRTRTSWSPLRITSEAERNSSTYRARSLLEIDLRRELHQPPGENRHRLQPRAARHERVVVGQDRVRVERVVEIDADHRPRPPVLQNLRDAEVELVDAVAVHRAGRE